MTDPVPHARVAAPELCDLFSHEVGCITCGDTTRRMLVLEADELCELALCIDELERRHSVDIGIVGMVAPGDTLLVHAGTALLREPA